MVFSGCSTSKDSSFAEFYHNLTARFNGYFNAKEIMLEQEAKIFDEQELDFKDILPLTPSTTETTAKTYKAELDKIKEKTTRVIQKHEISKWIDDNYLVLGKSYYYKRDFFAATEVFQFLAVDYPKTLPGQEAQIWLAKCYLSMGKQNEAQARISALSSNKKLEEDLYYPRDILNTEYLIEIKDYEKAVVLLEKLYKKTKGKRYKVRYSFVLGQLYQKLNNFPKSEYWYLKTIRKNPEYKFAFNARINLIDVASNKNVVEKQLQKMLKDDKNIDFRDQIYFQLARLEKNRGKIDKAIDYLKLSTQTSKNNAIQKTESFIELGDIFFNKQEFVNSKNYYDSAKSTLPAEAKGFETFKKKQQAFDNLLKNLIIIQTQDSLIKLAELPNEERLKFIDSLIEDDKRKAIEGIKDQKTYQTSVDIPNLNFNDPNAQSQSVQGYFYSPVALKKGFTNFKQKWGDRPLQDNWRTVRTSTTIENNSKEGDNVDIDLKDENNSEENIDDSLKLVREKYLEQIPLNPALKSAAKNSIQEAVYQVGKIYNEEINDAPLAIKFFEQLISEFPDNQYLVVVYYELFKLHKKVGNFEKSEYYKNEILTKHSNTVQAEYIRNPASLVQSKEKDPILEKNYSDVYLSFQENNCSDINKYYIASKDYAPNNEYLYKIKYLNLICLLKQDTNAIVLDSLKAFGEKYKENELGFNASQLYKKISESQLGLNVPQLPKDSATNEAKQEENKPQKPEVPYKYDVKRKHYFLLLVPSSTDFNKLKTLFSDKNKIDNPTENLRVMNFGLNDEFKFIMIDNFKDTESCLSYYKNFIDNSSFANSLEVKEKLPIIISDSNFSLFMRDKDINAYKKFFDIYYF